MFFDLSKLTHRESLKRSFVGVGGLEVRERQRLALTLMCYLMVAHLKNRTESVVSCLQLYTVVRKLSKRLRYAKESVPGAIMYV